MEKIIREIREYSRRKVCLVSFALGIVIGATVASPIAWHYGTEFMRKAYKECLNLISGNSSGRDIRVEFEN